MEKILCNQTIVSLKYFKKDTFIDVHASLTIVELYYFPAYLADIEVWLWRIMAALLNVLIRTIAAYRNTYKPQNFSTKIGHSTNKPRSNTKCLTID